MSSTRTKPRYLLRVIVIFMVLAHALGSTQAVSVAHAAGTAGLISIDFKGGGSNYFDNVTLAEL